MRRARWTSGTFRHPLTWVAIVGVIAGAGCAPEVTVPGWAEQMLTRSGADTYRVTAAPEGLVVTMPATNSPESNTRSLLFRPDTEPSSDQQVCLTATHDGDLTQEGVALRISRDDGRIRAITVTRNVFAGGTSWYNLHVWDTALGGAVPATLLSSTDMTAALPTDAATPRRMCARVEGARLTFKVWTAALPEPEWTDPVLTATVELPPETVREGIPGLYIGHLRPGWSATLDGVTMTPVERSDEAAA